MIWDRYLVFSCQLMEGRNSLKNHHEQRFFRTEHVWWTLKCSVIWSTEVQTSRLSIMFSSTFCKVKSREDKVFVVNTYTFLQYFSTWDAATLTTNSTVMVWVGLVLFLSNGISHFLVKTALFKKFRTLTNHLFLTIHTQYACTYILLYVFILYLLPNKNTTLENKYLHYSTYSN